MQDKGIVVRGGNISIAAVQVDANPGFQSASSGSSDLSLDVSANDTADSGTSSSSSSSSVLPALKPRRAAFNGSLGFFTLGLSLQVLGDFTLQRTMAWRYAERLNCWTTAVSMKGTFRLTRDELLSGLVVSAAPSALINNLPTCCKASLKSKRTIG
jgi:hypothetical protein